jgi:hypothetical protein
VSEKTMPAPKSLLGLLRGGPVQMLLENQPGISTDQGEYINVVSMPLGVSPGTTKNDCMAHHASEEDEDDVGRQTCRCAGWH